MLAKALPALANDPGLFQIRAEDRVTFDFRNVPQRGLIEVSRSPDHGSDYVDNAVYRAVREELEKTFEERTGKPAPKPRTRHTQFGRKAGKKPAKQWAPTAQQRREAAVFDRRYPGTDD